RDLLLDMIAKRGLDGLALVVRELDSPLVSLYDRDSILASRLSEFSALTQPGGPLEAYSSFLSLGMLVFQKTSAPPLQGMLQEPVLDSSSMDRAPASSSPAGKKQDYDGRDATLLQLIGSETLGGSDKSLAAPELVFVVGGFLLEFHSYSPLFLAAAEFW
ncbi:hypothetical protein HDU91_001097, partial [Kappamyces sp. JEL0680]